VVLVSAAAILAPGCAAPSGISDQRTLVVEFQGVPGASEVQQLTRLGAVNPLVIPLAKAVALRSSRDPADYVPVAGVSQVLNLGPEEDPTVSVFIDVSDEPTQEDLAFVRSLGATTVGALSTRNRIAADLALSKVPFLGARPRFVGLEIVPPGDPLRPE
jgi:hypothetical protein